MRGRVDGMEAHGNSQIVRAYVPLADCLVMRLFFVLQARSWYLHDGI